MMRLQRAFLPFLLSQTSICCSQIYAIDSIFKESPRSSNNFGGKIILLNCVLFLFWLHSFSINGFNGKMKNFSEKNECMHMHEHTITSQ